MKIFNKRLSIILCSLVACFCIIPALILISASGENEVWSEVSFSEEYLVDNTLDIEDRYLEVSGKSYLAKVKVVYPNGSTQLLENGKLDLSIAGVYKIVLEKYEDGASDAKETVVVYKTFSYSKEYEWVESTEENDLSKAKAETLASRGNGQVVDAKDIENVSDVFATFKTKIKRSYDPRTVFMTIAICAFLLDIAVRKFKFKWLHEIIRERKEKNNLK